ncbi:hypothetical protein L5D93_07135 [Paenibacillus thiaminolyticus]|nr:hypothetical protein [Paenibacillus thiaminolyticus]
MRQNEMWQPVLTELYNSLYGQQMVCSMSTELFHIPETQNLQGNSEMHASLVPASYHRVTAAGSAQRLVNGESAPTIIATLVACIQNAERLDRGVRSGLLVMRDAAPADYKPVIEIIIRWQEHAESHLQKAKELTNQNIGAAPRFGYYTGLRHGKSCSCQRNRALYY